MSEAKGPRTDARDAAGAGSPEPSPVQGFAVVPFSVELESICTFALPPLAVPEPKPFERRHRSSEAFELLLEAQEGPCFEEWLRTIGEGAPAAHAYDAEEFLPRPAALADAAPQPPQPQPPSAEKQAGLGKARRTKKAKPLPKWLPADAQQAPGAPGFPKPEPKAQGSQEQESAPHLSPRLGKSLSEYPTDDSLQAVEPFAPHGLAGSLPYFRLGLCTICQARQFVFWLGDAMANKPADKFFCIDCIKVQIGELQLQQILSQDAGRSHALSKDLEDLPCVVAHGCARVARKPETAEEHACLSRLLEAKLAEAGRLFARMLAVVERSHEAQDLQSRLLAVLFLSENIDAQVRLHQILRTGSLLGKLERLQQPERAYFYREAAKINSFIALQAVVDRARRPCELADLHPFFTELKQPPAPKKPPTLFSFDDNKPLLAKRDPEELFADFTV